MPELVSLAVVTWHMDVLPESCHIDSLTNITRILHLCPMVTWPVSLETALESQQCYVQWHPQWPRRGGKAEIACHCQWWGKGWGQECQGLPVQLPGKSWLETCWCRNAHSPCPCCSLQDSHPFFVSPTYEAIWLWKQGKAVHHSEHHLILQLQSLNNQKQLMETGTARDLQRCTL